MNAAIPSADLTAQRGSGLKRRRPWGPALLGFLVSVLLAFGQAPAPETMRGVNRGKAKPVVPVLLVGANEIVGSVVEPGWPLIVAASRQPGLTTASVPFPADLQVKVTNDRGVVVPLTFERVPPPPNVVDPAAIHWIAAGASTTRLASGSYRVTLVSGSNPLTGWQVELGEFRVQPPNSDYSGMEGFLNMQRSALLGRDDEALAEADHQIATHGNDPNLWIAKGDILMSKDKPDDALAAYHQALGLWKKTDREPLAIMARRQKAFQRMLEKRGVIPVSATPP